ncbi:uncharacterized protein LOC144101491 [Amblyomma americanum]
MASDGLCDVAFYDSIYADNTNFLYGGSPFDSDLVTFMRAATRYTRTSLGVAFAFQHMDRLGNDLRKTNPGPLELFWQSGIYHTGILDTPTNASRNQMTTAMYRLRELDNLGQSQRALGHQPLTVLAVPAPGKQWMYFLDEDFQRLQFIPNYIVVYGHYQFGDNTVENCAVMPPTRLSAVALPPQLRTTYLYELTAGPQALRELERKQVPTHALLSVTMKGRWTTVYPGQPLDFFSRCELNPSAKSFGSYAEVCKDRNYQYNLRYEPQHYAVLTYESTNRSAFTYDNEDGLAAKLCKVKYQERDVIFGIAAYDVDYDDYANECGSINKFGENSRLKALRKIVDFYKNLGSQMFNEASCTTTCPYQSTSRLCEAGLELETAISQPSLSAVGSDNNAPGRSSVFIDFEVWPWLNPSGREQRFTPAEQLGSNSSGSVRRAVGVTHHVRGLAAGYGFVTLAALQAPRGGDDRDSSARFSSGSAPKHLPSHANGVSFNHCTIAKNWREDS